MAMIYDAGYALHAIRLSALRTTDDPVTPRIVTLDPTFGLNPYISAMGLGDVDRWPEIKRALDSPPPEPEPSLAATPDEEFGRRRGATGLRYTQTIMGKGGGGAGMRVSGRRIDASDVARRLRTADRRANSSSHDMRPPVPPRSADRPRPADEDPFAVGFAQPLPRPRSDSAPIASTAPARESIVDGGRSVSETSGDVDDDMVTVEDAELGLKVPPFGMASVGTMGYPSSIIAASALPSDLGMATGSAPLADPLAGEAVDEGSDVDEDEVDEDDPVPPPLARRPSQALRDSHGHMYNGARVSVIHEEERRSSTDTNAEVQLEFNKVSVVPAPAGASALTSALNQHVPHLVSTGAGAPAPLGIATSAGANPFASLYASVAAPPNVPSLALELFFPHSDKPSVPIHVSVRKDATVEEVTGHGLYRYWEEGLEPKLGDTNGSVNWGLRIVEDDGEVDEDFPPLDRESQISKFSYGQFGIVEATDTQKKQNEAMAPMIQRRPSRVIVDLARTTQPPTPSAPTPPMRRQNSAAPTPEEGPKSSIPSTAGGKQVLLRVRVSAGADVNFTSTISVPSDMYIADLTEVLVRRKLLQLPSSDWVLCLADLTLALPLDRTVASLEDKTDLTLVRRSWAAEHGLRPGGVRGGDPSQSIFKRSSEPVPHARLNTLEFGGGAQTFKKWTVQRKTPIGRHERVLAVDGDYVYILPSENRAFFDTMKSTSFHITLVANCKLSGRAGNPGFKLYVWRDGSRKRYEFEAENGKQAAEIIASIKELMKTFQAERNTMLAPMRTMSQLGTLPTKR